MEIAKYLFRRQFILGPRHIESLPAWKRLTIDDRLFLTIHPDLEISKVSYKNNFTILLGFILDPHNPFFSNKQIIKNIIEHVLTADDIFDLVATKGGRFLLIVKVNNDLRIFSDAVGFRQIFYYKDDSNNIWCASQPSNISEQCNLDVSEVIEKDLFRLPFFSDTWEYFYPGNITLYKDIFHLTPNHYLDLNTGEVVRYWPQKQLKPISFQQCVEESSEILKGLFKSACNRFDLALAITAGFDTRVLLAASRREKEKIYFITHTHSKLNENGPDIAIPRAMLNQIGLEHHIAYHSQIMSEEFEKLCQRNITSFRTGKGLNAYAIYQHFNKINHEMVMTNGEIGGIAKSFYQLPSFFKIKGKTLSALTNMYGSKIAEKGFDTWLKSARRAEDCGINILDILYWEGRMANWSAMESSEYDIAFESFSPFNCNRLLENLLCVDRKYRLRPHNRVHIQLIHKMWPELLRFPINPPTNWKQAIKKKAPELYEVWRFLIFLRHYYLNR